MKKNLAAAFLLSVFALASLGAETLPLQPEKDDFLEAYRLALQLYGVNASYEELACLNGLPFTPLRSSETSCGRNVDFPYSCQFNVQRLNNFYRLRNEERTFSAKEQISSSKRTEYRKLISDSQREGVPAIQFAKLPGQLSPTWHYVEPGTGLTLRAVYRDRAYTYQGVPEKVWLIKKSSRPASTDSPQVFIFENIGKLLNGTTTVSFLIGGVNMLREFADGAYAMPWCPECNSPFNNCIHKHLLRWQNDSRSALKLFPFMRQLCQTEEERSLINLAEKEYKNYSEAFTAILADPAWDHPQTDLAAQTIMGEKIRKLTLPLMNCAECFFNLANKRNSLSQEYYSPSKRSQLISDKLANTIVDMQIDSRYEGSLACSLLIACQLSGSDRPSFVTRAIAGLPVRLVLRTNDWYFCREINEGVDMKDALAEACGFRLRSVTTKISDSEAATFDSNIKRVYDAAIRKVIENISVKKHALVGANLNRSGYWGVIAGYNDYGFTWLGRSALDSPPKLLEFTTLPTDIILVDGALPKQPFEDDVALALSRWIKQIKGTNSQGCLTGGKLFSCWMREVASWMRHEELPEPKKASVNRSLWNTMIDGRSDALTFVNHLTKAVPIISIPMAEAKEILERELTIARSALNNGYVLGYENSRYQPTKFDQSSFMSQIDAMRQIAEQDRLLLTHLETALQTLRK
ncbi:hypothetical protein IKS38_02100 [bacterium]|nr:hypothetical protein [bacterium]